MNKIYVGFLFLFSLTGCSLAIDGKDYEHIEPSFHLTDFFSGNVQAWGIVQNRSGEVVQRFTVDIHGRVEEGVLIMDETFSYGLGTGPQQRTWQIVPHSDGQFIGQADDILGEARGRAHGNAFNFTYDMDLLVDDSVYQVSFDDWFFAFDREALMNRSYIRKFGIVMAEVTIFMHKTE
jgi:hypothetical protein